MAVSDYSTTPASNTAISGISVGENVMSPADVNNAIRQLMADVRVFYDSVSGGGGGQAASAILSAIAGLGWAADKMMYATGTETFAVFDSTAFGRSLLGAADAAAAASLIGSGGAGSVSGTATSGSQAIGSLTLTWKRFSLSGNLGTGSTTQTFGDSHTYSSWANAWIEGDDQTAGDISKSYYINNTETTTTGATIHYAQGATSQLTLFSIGV